MEISKNAIRQIGPYEWLIEEKRFPGMHVPVVLFMQESMLNESLNDRSIVQAIHAASIPGVVNKVCVMPDMHQGYGFPIGGVAATSVEEGVVVPGAIGYDINCGVRFLSSSITEEALMPFIDALLDEINNACPSGVGKGGRFRITKSDLERVCQSGVNWARENNMLEKDGHLYIEDYGNIKPDDLDGISKKAFDRGLPQLGSLGAGNHFIEIDIIRHIFDDRIAEAFGLKEGMVAVQIHSGSRGFGHQICTDFVRLFNDQMDQFKYDIPDRELACAPVQSRLGRRYISAMNAAANYAFVNRQLLAYSVSEAFSNILEKNGTVSNLSTVYDLAHNIGKLERIKNHGKLEEVFIHRKGATRCLGPGNNYLPEVYIKTGQPVLVPGSMGTQSWVLVGTSTAEEKSMNSCCHGAGRVLSRSKARKKIHGPDVVNNLGKRGIKIVAGSQRMLSEEAPQAYKDVNAVVDTIEGVGIAKKVAVLTPIAVVKG